MLPLCKPSSRPEWPLLRLCKPRVGGTLDVTQFVGLRQAYSSLQQLAPDTIEYIDHPRWRTLLFTMCLCHTVLHERSKVGSLGFTTPYELGDADLMHAIDTLRALSIDTELKRNPALIWAPLQYMVAEVVYGSMMLDEWDHRIIRTYAKGYFQPNLVETGVCLLPDLLLPVGQTTDKYLEFIEKLPMRDHLKHCGLSDAVSMPIHADHLRSFCQVLESHAGPSLAQPNLARPSLAYPGPAKPTPAQPSLAQPSLA